MGGCMSCKFPTNDGSKIYMSKTEIRNLMIQLLESHEFTDLQKMEDRNNIKIEEEGSVKQISPENDEKQLEFELLNISLLDSKEDSNDYDKNFERLNSKGLRETKNGQNFRESIELHKNNSNLCEDKGLEESHCTRDANIHQISKDCDFISTPLTYEDVSEILDVQDPIESVGSGFYFNSSWITNIEKSEELTDFLSSLNYCSGETQTTTLGTDHRATVNQSDLNFNANNIQKIQDPTVFYQASPDNGNYSPGQILNAVPVTYDYFKRKQVKERKVTIRRKDSIDKTRKKSRELLSLIYSVNKYKRNIIHQLVISKNHNGLETILECLHILTSLQLCLEAVDIFYHTPFAYAVIICDVKAIQILLKFHPQIPQYIYFKSMKNCIPTLHKAYQLIDRSYKENLFAYLCHYLKSSDGNALKEILETKDSAGLTILHYVIVHYTPPDIIIKKMDEKPNSYFYINYLLQLGANLQTKCTCYFKKEIEVDALGQVIFSKYPLEILRHFIEFPLIKNSCFEWHYVVDNISYKLEELLSLRTDISQQNKKDIDNLLFQLK